MVKLTGQKRTLRQEAAVKSLLTTGLFTTVLLPFIKASVIARADLLEHWPDFIISLFKFLQWFSTLPNTQPQSSPTFILCLHLQLHLWQLPFTFLMFQLQEKCESRYSLFRFLWASFLTTSFFHPGLQLFFSLIPTRIQGFSMMSIPKQTSPVTQQALQVQSWKAFPYWVLSSLFPVF